MIQKLVRDHPQIVRYRQALGIGDTGLAGLYRKVRTMAGGTRAA